MDVYHHHWLAFWRRILVISLLATLGAVGFLVWTPMGLGLWILALIWTISLYLAWSWHTLSFSPDNKLIRRRGFFGTTRDLISLFGVVTPYQTPIFGQWLDIGSVYLGIPGPDIHILHVADFHAFQTRLLYGAQQAQSDPQPPVQVIVQVQRPIFGRLGQVPMDPGDVIPMRPGGAGQD